MLSQYIDGPVNPELERFPSRTIAAALVRNTIHFSWIHANDIGTEVLMQSAEQSDPQAERLTTWVEAPDHRDGYAYGVSSINPHPNTINGYSLTGIFFKVDRSTHTVIEDPKGLPIQNSNSADAHVEQTLATYTKEEMVLAISMLSKLKNAIATRDRSTMVDRDVIIGISQAYLDTLAARWPTPTAIARTTTAVTD